MKFLVRHSIRITRALGDSQLFAQLTSGPVKVITTRVVVKMNPKIHYRVHNSPTLDPVLSKMNPLHTLTLR